MRTRPRPEGTLQFNHELVKGAILFHTYLKLGKVYETLIMKGPTPYVEMADLGPREIAQLKDNPLRDTMWYRSGYVEHGGSTWNSCADVNLDGGGYNDNYLFHTREDALRAIEEYKPVPIKDQLRKS